MKKKVQKSGKKDKIRQGGRKRRSWKLRLLLFACIAIAAFFGYMHIQARLVRLCHAELYLADLPAQMDGTTILFVSDLNIQSAAEAAQMRRLFGKLEQLQPDILILGGDYSANTLFETLNGDESASAPEYVLDFIRSLSDFSAPLGKFAVLGDMDTDASTIGQAFAGANVALLSDACATVGKDDAQIVIAGLNDAGRQTTPYTRLGDYFTGEECVIAVAHNPSSYIGIRVNEARGGGAWADAVLSGHTLGGQIRVLGRNIRTLSDEESRCLSGWFYADDLPLLVSQGLGCQDVDLRLNTRSEVWLITLRQQKIAVLPDF